jgi:hypothetical protein
MYRKSERRQKGRYLHDPFVNAVDRDSQDHLLLEEMIDAVAQAILAQGESLCFDCPRAATIKDTVPLLEKFLQEEIVRPAWAEAAFCQVLPLLDLAKIARVTCILA